MAITSAKVVIPSATSHISTVSHVVFHHSHGQISLLQWDNNICPYIYMAVTSAITCDFHLSQYNQLPLKSGGLHQPL